MHFAALAVPLLLASAAPVAGVVVVDRVESYAIDGKSAAQLRDQMHFLGPVDAVEGKRFDGITDWHVSWSYTLQPLASGCTLDDIKVTITTVMTLPRWNGYAAAGSSLRAAWDTFAARLREHEEGHRRNGRQAAEGVWRILRDAGKGPDCNALGHRVDSEARAVIGRSGQADHDYDAATAHGAKQGVAL